MEIQLSISVSDNSVQKEKVILVFEMSERLNTYFSNLNYGENLKKVHIGFLMVLERPGYEEWYKPKKPKYTDYQCKVNLAGEEMVLEKTFSYEIKLSDEQLYRFTGGDIKLSENVVAVEIVNSLPNLDKIPKKIKDFDKDRFKTDMIHFLISQGMIFT